MLGQVLAVEAVRPEDAGTYRCSASNEAGQTSADTRLEVIVPLRVQVRNAFTTMYFQTSDRSTVTVGHTVGDHTHPGPR